MVKKSVLFILLIFGLFFIPLSVTFADGEVPPPGSKPLSKILQSVEEQKSGVVAEVEFEDGLWEVTVCEADACEELHIDPESGGVKQTEKTGSEETPPDNAMQLSKIVQTVEDREQGIVTEVEFDDEVWEIELLKNGEEMELEIDPATGEIKAE